MTPPTVNIEREAIAVLAERGWRKAGQLTTNGECLYLAMAAAPGRNNVYAFDSALHRVADVIREQYADRVPGPLSTPESVMFRFNDHPDTTVDDVILVLEKAALRRDEVVGVSYP